MALTVSRTRLAVALVGTAGVLAPAASAGAAEAPYRVTTGPAGAPPAIAQATVKAPISAQDVVDAQLRKAAHEHQLESTMHSTEHLADLRGKDVPAARRRYLAERTTYALHAEQQRLRGRIHEVKAAKAARRKQARLAKQAKQAAQAGGATTRAGASGSTAVPGNLQAIAACESGGNPGAIGGGGAYRGKYQFSYSTWQSVGGSGDPAAAPEAEQDRRAAQLYAQAGAGQWPVCGR